LVEDDARYYDYRGPKAIEIGGQSPTLATIDHYKKDFPSGYIAINEVVLEGVSPLKKSLSARSAVQKRPETRPKHYENDVFSL
jgi:hypothetical protein